MMNIEWKEGAVCFAFGHQWVLGDKILSDKGDLVNVELEVLKSMISEYDFQLNIIKQGDYIATSELDTEQKYNDAVEIFELFGFFVINNLVNQLNYKNSPYNTLLAFNGDQVLHVPKDYFDNKRKITHSQLMATGELKRMMNERDNLVLNSNEETELKSRAMVSELNSETNDEWPKVGDDVIIESPYHCAGLSRVEYLSDKFVIFKRGNDEHSELTKNCTFKKPKSKEEILRDELIVIRNRSEDCFIDELLKNFKLTRKESK